jgi:hypothetical protein
MTRCPNGSLGVTAWRGRSFGSSRGQEASRAAAVVRLDEEVTVGEVAGSIVVLELRYADAMWTPEGIAHVELCDFEPEPTASGDRRRGRWVESHASYRRLGQST